MPSVQPQRTRGCQSRSPCGELVGRLVLLRVSERARGLPQSVGTVPTDSWVPRHGVPCMRVNTACSQPAVALAASGGDRAAARRRAHVFPPGKPTVQPRSSPAAAGSMRTEDCSPADCCNNRFCWWQSSWRSILQCRMEAVSESPSSVSIGRSSCWQHDWCAAGTSEPSRRWRQDYAPTPPCWSSRHRTRWARHSAGPDGARWNIAWTESLTGWGSVGWTSSTQLSRWDSQVDVPRRVG